MELTVHLLVMLSNLSNALDGVHDRGVITASKGLANFRKALLGKFLGKVHGYLPRPGNVGGPALAVHVSYFDLEEVGDSFLDRVDGNRCTVERENVFQGLAGKLRAYGFVSKARKRDDPQQRPFQFTHVGRRAMRVS